MIQLIFFLVGMGCVSSIGFGLYTYQNLPHMLEELEKLKAQTAITSGQTIRSHIIRREYEKDMEQMRVERDEMEKEIKELIKALGQRP